VKIEWEEMQGAAMQVVQDLFTGFVVTAVAVLVLGFVVVACWIMLGIHMALFPPMLVVALYLVGFVNRFAQEKKQEKIMSRMTSMQSTSLKPPEAYAQQEQVHVKEAALPNQEVKILDEEQVE